MLHVTILIFCKISNRWTMCSTADRVWSVVMLNTWSAMEVFKSFIVATAPHYSRHFKWNQNQKSHGFKSGERDGHVFWKKQLTTHSSVKCWSNRDYPDLWFYRGAPSCMKTLDARTRLYYSLQRLQHVIGPTASKGTCNMITCRYFFKKNGSKDICHRKSALDSHLSRI